MIRTVYYFSSEDGFDDYAMNAEERDELHSLYLAAGSFFTIEELRHDDGNDNDPLPF